VDIHDIVYVHIDKKKKFPATALLRAFGYGSNSDILRLFFAVRELDLTKERESRTDIREVIGAIIAEDIELPGEATAEDAPKARTKKAKAERERSENALLVKEGDELTEEVYNRLRRQGIKAVKVFASYMTIDLRDEQDAIERQERPTRRMLAIDVVSHDGEVIAEASQTLSDALIKKIRKAEINKVKVFVTSGRAESTMVKNTLAKDPTARYYKKEGGEQREYAVDSKTGEELALKQIYGLLRPGDAPDTLTAKQALERLFFSPKRYDLGRVGRYKINQRLGLNTPADLTVLTKEDFVEIVRYLVELHEGRGHVDDIDHLGNRRIRSVGELIANQFSVGLSRMARLVKERMSINTGSREDLARRSRERAYGQRGDPGLLRIVAAVAVHGPDESARRADAQASSVGAGPGGLTRERAGFEVRDVHYSQYGRMCPIETPEGPNIGLITSLACYARVNDLGLRRDAVPCREERQGHERTGVAGCEP
jgi:DNA-directed RNA polymerase subunit beta